MPDPENFRLPKHVPRRSLRTPAITAVSATMFSAVFLTLSAQNAKAQSAGDATEGEAQFEATCAECHGAAATAPTLRGVVNRSIASVDSFLGYSEAIKAKKGTLTWTKENLNTYLTDPSKFVPGNAMYREYPDPKMRADIIAFLATLPAPK